MNRMTKLLMSVGLMLIAGAAAAHPGHGVHTHSDFLSGLLHPMLGIDHLLAMAAIGFWSIRQSTAMKNGAPLFVVGGMILGAVLAWSGLNLSGVETGIAMSVLLAGVLIATMAKLPTVVGGTLVTLFMITHGYAHGAEMTAGASLFSYLAGFVVATLAITFVGRRLGELMLSADNRVTRALGGVVAVVGGVLAAG
ncbi:MAG: HupE/UreJ family protein [Marinobacter sp.]|uniref:HupE/UreJ family protein n=1 Tax=Marinobacter sp. TaxID=50741 RepID=UPI002B26F382|nr:HupE/UreJ family protein [Marinobacter sp.]